MAANETKSPLPSMAMDFGEAWENWTDRWQRSVLFWDVMRKRGNQSIEHWQEGKPPVLVFDYETVIDGRTLGPSGQLRALDVLPGLLPGMKERREATEVVAWSRQARRQQRPVAAE